MKLKQILLEFMPSAEIKQRLSNNQIKLNNEPIKNVDIEINTLGHYDELGDFIYHNINNLKDLVVDIKDFFGEEETNINKLQFLTGFNLISISKKEHYVFIIN